MTSPWLCGRLVRQPRQTLAADGSLAHCRLRPRPARDVRPRRRARQDGRNGHVREAERYPIRVIRRPAKAATFGSDEGLRGTGVGCRLPSRARMLRSWELRCADTACEMDDSARCTLPGNRAASCVMADPGSKGQRHTSCRGRPNSGGAAGRDYRAERRILGTVLCAVIQAQTDGGACQGPARVDSYARG